MKDPTARNEWTISFCSECRQDTHFHRIRSHTFRCIFCARDKEIRDLDRDRNRLLE